jgi:cell wall-associated NlpC family hydrolase
MSRRRASALIVAGVAAAAAALAFALPGHPTASAQPVAVHKTQEKPDLPPLPALHPTVVQPSVGGQNAPAAAAAAAESLPKHDPVPTRAATRDSRPAHADSRLAGSVTSAKALPNGVAVPPLEAPTAVREIIQAGDQIARTPYIWGGGHGKWLDHGYDCSGSVSYVLASAGLLDHSMVAAEFMRWGEPGPGKWVTIYASSGHVFMRVAGIRFDTVARAQTGSRWVNEWTDTSRYVARHPPGL